MVPSSPLWLLQLHDSDDLSKYKDKLENLNLQLSWIGQGMPESYLIHQAQTQLKTSRYGKDIELYKFRTPHLVPPVRKSETATEYHIGPTDKRASLRGEYENFLIPQTPSDVISTYPLAPQQGVLGGDENASTYYVPAAQRRSPQPVRGLRGRTYSR